MAVFSYCRRLDEQAEAERERRRDRRLPVGIPRRAERGGDGRRLGGRRHRGSGPRPGPPGAGIRPLAVGRRLEGAAGRRHRQPRPPTSRWRSWGGSRRYNRHPDLSARVEIHLGEGAGTDDPHRPPGGVAAWRHSTGCHLRGPVSVTLPVEGRRPFARRDAALDLDVGGPPAARPGRPGRGRPAGRRRPRRLPADRGRATWPSSSPAGAWSPWLRPERRSRCVGWRHGGRTANSSSGVHGRGRPSSGRR